MKTIHISDLAILVVAALHFLIAGVEMFLWKRPFVYSQLEKLNLNQTEADKVAPIVANAGLYNAFIASGLVWSFFTGVGSPAPKLLFLACVAIAGIFGAATLNWKPLVLQTLPALIAAILVMV